MEMTTTQHEKKRIYVHDFFLDSEERFEIYLIKAAERPYLLHYNPTKKCVASSCSSRISPPCHPIDGKYESKNENSATHYEPTTEMNDFNSNIEVDGCASDGDQEAMSPLLDGCDLPGWRKEGFVAYPLSAQAALNIGAASTMFRRDRQWPILPYLMTSNYFNLNQLYHEEMFRQSCKSDDAANGKHGNVADNKWVRLKTKMMILPSLRSQPIVINHEEYTEIINDPTSGRKATRFALEIEQKNIPAKILGCTVDWVCMPRYNDMNQEATISDVDNIWQLDLFSGGGVGGWTFANLLDRFGSIYWRFSDTHGEMMSLSTYAKYITNIEGVTDDSPLAIYDAEFGDDYSPTSEMVHEYSVPKCFSQDIFELACPEITNGDLGKNTDNTSDTNANINVMTKSQTDNFRPPWRWILIGPERSGTGLHVDPLYTNAWVTVLQGRKRWLLFPPSTPPEKIGIIPNQPQIPSSIWFRDYYDTTTGPEWPEEWKPVEVLQEVGETVFVPNGWPHLVLNLELTVAVTHNYASEFGPFERMWKQVVEDEPEFADRWLRGMQLCREKNYLVERIVKYHKDAVGRGEDWANEFALFGGDKNHT